MTELKTKQTDQDVNQFLDQISDEKKRLDSYKILELMKQVTHLEPKMWGGSMIGFGTYHYKYKSGHEGDAFLTGFSPRKQNLTIYILSGFENYEVLLSKLGRFKTAKSCLYIKKLDDIDLEVLKEMIKRSVQHMIDTNP